MTKEELEFAERGDRMVLYTCLIGLSFVMGMLIFGG
jgi:hypothetical protein